LVSHGQAARVRKAGVPRRKIVVIPNAIDADRFNDLDPTARSELERFFPRPVRRIVGAVGRLSPEKGFDILIDAASQVVRLNPTVGFVLFGDGFLREKLQSQIAAHQIADHFVLAGFRTDLDRFIPHFDVLVQSSYTEGMPNVVLEACSAGVPVIATSVGGTPEIIEDGQGGYLIATGEPSPMANRIVELLGDEPRRKAMGEWGRRRMRESFTFEAQAESYCLLFSEIAAHVPQASNRDP